MFYNPGVICGGVQRQTDKPRGHGLTMEGSRRKALGHRYRELRVLRWLLFPVFSQCFELRVRAGSPSLFCAIAQMRKQTQPRELVCPYVPSRTHLPQEFPG